MFPGISYLNQIARIWKYYLLSSQSVDMVFLFRSYCKANPKTAIKITIEGC